jgi:hypothetical protein
LNHGFITASLRRLWERLGFGKDWLERNNIPEPAKVDWKPTKLAKTKLVTAEN